MRLGLILLFLSALIWGREAAAAAPGSCPPYSRAIVLNFTTDTTPPIYNHSLNVAGIRNLFRSRGQTLGGLHDRALGITYVETALSMRGQSMLVPYQGGYCVYLTSVGADFGWQREEVFVASELVQGGCAYHAVLDHENQHVAINRETLQEFAPRIRAKLEEALQAQQPVFARETGQTTDLILAQLRAHVSGVIDQFSSTMGQRQAVIDTARNYGATSALCTDWGDTRRTN